MLHFNGNASIIVSTLIIAVMFTVVDVELSLVIQLRLERGRHLIGGRGLD